MALRSRTPAAGSPTTRPDRALLARVRARRQGGHYRPAARPSGRLVRLDDTLDRAAARPDDRAACSHVAGAGMCRREPVTYNARYIWSSLHAGELIRRTDPAHRRWAVFPRRDRHPARLDLFIGLPAGDPTPACDRGAVHASRTRARLQSRNHAPSFPGSSPPAGRDALSRADPNDRRYPAFASWRATVSVTIAIAIGEALYSVFAGGAERNSSALERARDGEDHRRAGVRIRGDDRACGVELVLLGFLRFGARWFRA